MKTEVIKKTVFMRFLCKCYKYQNQYLYEPVHGI